MEDKMTIEQLEIEKGFFLTFDHDPKNTMDPDEFIQYALENGAVGVNYNARVEFLQENGYEITRENLMNPDLSVRTGE